MSLSRFIGFSSLTLTTVMFFILVVKYQTMKRMNFIKLLGFAFLLFVMSCGPSCVNGVNTDGVCQCLEGWEGELCDIEERAKFLGTWEGTLSGCTIEIPLAGEFPIPDLPISMMFEAGSDVTELEIVLDMNTGSGTINGDKVTLDPTSMEFDAMGFPLTITISGVGELESDTRIDMDLTLEVLGNSTICPLELNKV